ncbi:MAG: TerB family tellurite resistance protein [Sulfurovaceae bacterium]|nr:TerB family tellurite resistance protein [Sulfurovaceae bacterium]
MGFFDKFSSTVELNPAIALAGSMIYIMASDGELAEEEMHYLASTLQSFGDAQELVDSAYKYSKKKDLETFQKEANEVLNHDQKMTVLANLIDLLLADGRAEEEEEELFFSFVHAFGVSEDEIQPFIDIISIKNDFAVFL